MDLAELIVSGSENQEQPEIDPITNPAEALDQHRKSWPLNQKVADGKIETPDGSDRIRLRRVGSKLTEMGYSVSGAEPSSYVRGAQVSFSTYFDRSGEAGAVGVSLSGPADNPESKAVIQEAMQSEGFGFIVTIHQNLSHLRADSHDQDSVRYAEAGGGSSRYGYGMGSRSNQDKLSPEEFLVWSATLGGATDWEIHNWKERGLNAAEAKQWMDSGVRSAYEVQAWQKMGQDHVKAAEWRDAGVPVHSADGWISQGLSPADAELWAKIGIFEQKVVSEWQAEGITPVEAQKWTSIRGVSLPQDVKLLMEGKFSADDAKQLAQAKVTQKDLQKIEKWITNYKIELAEAIEWAKLGPGFIGPGKRGRWHKAGFTPEMIEVWQAALGKKTISLDEVKALKASGYDPEAAKEWVAVHPDLARSEASAQWIEAGFTPRQAEDWIEVDDNFVNYSLVKGWVEAGMKPEDAEPWAEVARAYNTNSLYQRDRVEEWLQADPRCADPDFTARMTRLTDPTSLPELVKLLAE